MNRKIVIPVLTVVALAVASLFGFVVYRQAYAQTATPTTPTTPSTNAPVGKGFDGRGMGGVTDANLASALGITTDQLTSASTTARNDALAQAVSAGLITQAQADQIKANGSAFPIGDRWMNWLSQKGIDYQALLAKALGISADQLSAAYLKAYDAGIDQAVTNGQLTQAQADLMKGKYALYNNKDFQSSMQASYKTAVQNAVSAGVITQAQADAILSSTNGNLFPGFGGLDGFGGGRGGHGGRPGDGPGFGGPDRNGNSTGNPSNTTPATPSSNP